MILRQYYLKCLAHASYLLGDEESSTAIVVDPQRDIQQYVTEAEELASRFGTSSSRISTPTSSRGIWNCATVAARPSISARARRRSTRSTQ